MEGTTLTLTRKDLGLPVYNRNTNLCGTVMVVCNGHFIVAWENSEPDSYYSWNEAFTSGVRMNMHPEFPGDA